MAGSDFPPPQQMRPAARENLAAAGPVEPSSSRGLAPGPTFSLPASLCGESCRRRESPPLAGAGWRLCGGENTARRRFDPVYDLYRRHLAAIRAMPWEGDAEVLTLAFVPGITITGRYRMLRPS
jgi:hypothetical protein